MTITGAHDYIWTDGETEIEFGHDLAEAKECREARGQGKVWVRYFDEDGYLEGITEIEED